MAGHACLCPGLCEENAALRPTQETQLSAFLANRPGIVADFCAALTDHGVNIRAICVLDSVDVGTVRMVVDDVATAKAALDAAGAAYVEVPVVTLPISNTPGAFARMARTLAIRGVNIDYFYTTASPSAEQALGVFRVSDTEAALAVEFEDIAADV
jgi:hypothetical protein